MNGNLRKDDYMLEEYLNKLIKNQIYPRKYNAILDNISLQQENINANEIIDYINQYIDKSELICLWDLYLQLKNMDLIKQENINVVNEEIVKKYNGIRDENVKYYILGYLVQNNLLNDEIKQDEIYKNYFVREEENLVKSIIEATKACSPQSATFMKLWCEQIDEKTNIFKVGELLREIFINNNQYKYNFNIVSNEILKLMKNEEFNEYKHMKDLEFLLSVYQDTDFINDYVIENVIPKINSFMCRINSKSLNNIFNELADTIHFNRLANKIIDKNKYRSYQLGAGVKAAARGGNYTYNDFEKLNNYFKKILKTNKLINKDKLNFKFNYTACDILKMTNQGNSNNVDLKRIIEQLNIQYYETEFENILDGFSFKLVEQGKAAIIINKNSIDVRKKFTIAHELGHICSNIKQNDNFDNLLNIHLYQEGEKSANKFAGELLIPNDYLEEFQKRDLDIYRVQEVSTLFNVSIEAAAIRIINSINGSYCFTVYKNNRLHYRVNSQYVRDIDINDDIEGFIISNDEAMNKWVRNAQISMIKKNNLKFIILNYKYD